MDVSAFSSKSCAIVLFCYQSKRSVLAAGQRSRQRAHTPRLDVNGDNGLGSGLGLALLLLAVLGETLLTDTLSLGIFLLIIRAKQVDVVVVVVGSRGLGGVQGDLGGVGAVDGVGLGGITRESGKLILVGGDVLVPPSGVGVLGRVGGGGDGLEGHDVGLGSGVAGQAQGQLC